MKTSLFHLDYALIQPRHFNAAVARLGAQETSGPLATRKLFSDDDDDENDDADPESPYWWGSNDAWNDPMPQPSKAGSTAIIPVKGVITSGLPTVYRAFGFCDTEEIAGWVRAAMEDNDVTRIVLDIDSPGGMVTGTPELGAMVDAATAVKQVKAFSKGMCDSGAYWIASQADEVWGTPSSDIGCIGVYQVNYDFSGWLEQNGVAARMFKSGDLKGAGHPDIPLSAAQAAHIQAEIDAIGVQFRSAVKSKRTMVEDDTMRGQSFIGTEAAARNLIAGFSTLEKLCA
jgi:signal peptide peptidase SppA